MLENVKRQLLDNPEHIVNLLELYDFYKIKMHNNEIRFAREPDSNPTAVVIRLLNNDALYVKDYELNISCDLIDYFIKQRRDSFKNVLNRIKNELGIDSIEVTPKRRGFFNNMYVDRFTKASPMAEVTIYPESLLQNYNNIPNYRFFYDGISWETQTKFGIGFDVLTQRITIPIRNATGDLIGVKGRLNDEPKEYDPKYLYLINCPASQTLYGYYENYQYLLDGTVIILESEKSVMQLDSMGYHNGVALGSNSLSTTQAKLINKLTPKRVIFALDNSLNLANTARDAKILLEHKNMQDYTIEFFNWEKCDLLQPKDSPTDRGEKVFQQIMEHYIESIDKIIDKADEEIDLSKKEDEGDNKSFFGQLFAKKGE